MSQIAIYRVRDTNIGSAARLAKYYECASLVSSTYKDMADHTLMLNFGRSRMPRWWDRADSKGCYFFNHPHAVARAVDKVKTLSRLNLVGVPTLTHTVRREVAEGWQKQGHSIIVRHKIRSCCGRGIELLSPSEELPTAPLYTIYIKKQREWRAHVFCGRVIDIQLKKKMGKTKRAERGIKKVDDIVRTNANGWVFARMDIDPPEEVSKVARNAIAALGLDFGAVDLLEFDEGGGATYRQHVYVCEVNTSPSLSDESTFVSYVRAISRALDHGTIPVNPSGLLSLKDKPEEPKAQPSASVWGNYGAGSQVPHFISSMSDAEQMVSELEDAIDDCEAEEEF